jgi:hypothetical protein
MLENPTTIVIFFITIVAVIVLGYYGYNAFKRYLSPDQKKPWPPVLSSCPDYWKDLGSGTCQNVHLLGECSNVANSNTMNWSTDGDTVTVQGRERLCDKVKSCKISWEGIDNLC